MQVRFQNEKMEFWSMDLGDADPIKKNYEILEQGSCGCDSKKEKTTCLCSKENHH